jgi:predicted nucleotidyltransferase
MSSRNEILVKNSGSDIFKGLEKTEFLNLLKQTLNERVIEAWIFGSLAHDTWTSSSDIDLIVVTNSNLPFIERPKLFLDLWDLTDRLDLLVYTPSEFKDLTTDPSPGFWRTVTKEMTRLL